MSGEIRVPELGESVVEVTVQSWLKQPGDPVEEGEPLVELETEKANVEVPAEQSGVLQEISRQEGETVGVGDVLGTIGEGDASQAQATTAEPPAQEQREPASEAQPSDSTETADRSEQAEKGAFALPAARRLAEEHQIDLGQVRGSGRGGRISREDVEAFIGQREAPGKPEPAAPTVQPQPAAQAPTQPPAATQKPQAAPSKEEARTRREPMSRRRQTIARRLVEAKQNAAMLTTFNEVDMSRIMELRKRRGEEFRERYGAKLGFMSFFTKAVVGALKSFPYLNSEIQGTDILVKEYYDIGIAVGSQEGLVVPVVRDADRKSFGQLEQEIAELASKARAGKLTLEDLRGGTFTISNGGVYGSLMSTPILNGPQAGILGMHTIKQRPMVVDGEIVARPMMYLALSYDHRIVDGSESVRFLVSVKEMIEDPETLLLQG